MLVRVVVSWPCSKVWVTDLSVSHRVSVSGAADTFLSNNASRGLGLFLSRRFVIVRILRCFVKIRINTKSPYHCQLREVSVSIDHCQRPVKVQGLKQLKYASAVFPMGHYHVTPLLMNCWHCQRESPSSWCHCKVCEFLSPGISSHCHKMSHTGNCFHFQGSDLLSQRQEALLAWSENDSISRRAMCLRAV